MLRGLGGGDADRVSWSPERRCVKMKMKMKQVVYPAEDHNYQIHITSLGDCLGYTMEKLSLPISGGVR